MQPATPAAAALRRRRRADPTRTADDDDTPPKIDSPRRATSESEMGQALARLDLSRLLRRLVHEDGLGSNARAASAIEEYKRFLRLVWMHPEMKLLPSKSVDLVWQRHILDTKAYEEDCLALFGEHLHRIYGESEPDVSLEHTRGLLYQSAFSAPPSATSEELWKGVATVPAAAMASPSLPRLPRAEHPPSGKSSFEDVEDQDLEWLGVAVAQELPLKQVVCAKSEPLRQIAIEDPSATVVEYKKFLRMMVDDHGAWFTPSKLVDELWHRHMLDSVAYCDFCGRVNGAYLHHTPHYGEPHSFHDPGFTATLKAYENKFAGAPPSSIWGTVGESGGGGGGCGGGGGGGGCGGGGHHSGGLVGGHGGGGSPTDSLCCIMLCPCICLVVFLSVVVSIVNESVADSCKQEHPNDAEICFNHYATPVQSDGDWVIPAADAWSPGNDGGSGDSCSRASSCMGGEFCNFDDGDSGFCESCNDCGGCFGCGLPEAGAQDCAAKCGAVAEPSVTSLGSCNDLMTSQMNRNGTSYSEPVWKSNNPRTNVGKTCREYERQRLCKLCDRFPEYTDGSPGGDGWDPAWGSPADSQYSNGGMTAVDACCACGGGDTPLVDQATCNAAVESCEVLEECQQSKAGLVTSVLTVLALVVVACCIKKAMDSRKKRQETAAVAVVAAVAAGEQQTPTVATVSRMQSIRAALTLQLWRVRRVEFDRSVCVLGACAACGDTVACRADEPDHASDCASRTWTGSGDDD